MKKTPHGFTLVEMLIVTSLTVVVGGVLMMSITFFYRDNAYVFSEASMVGDARRSVSDILGSVRGATYGADGSYPLEVVEGNRLALYVDRDSDGVVDRVEYYLEGTVLFRAVTVPEGTPYIYGDTPTQVDEMTAYASSTSLFAYTDQSGALLAEPVDAALVRGVRVMLTVDTDGARPPEPLTLEGSATLRNVRN